MDKLEIGQKIKYSGSDTIYTISFVGKSYYILDSHHGEEVLRITDASECYNLVKPEPKEIEVKWYKHESGSIICDYGDSELNGWVEIDCIEGKFYEKEVK